MIMSQCWPLKMPPSPKAVLISLADNANDQGHCWPSIDTIGERTCLSRRAVIDAIKWLEAAGALTADRSNGRHTTYQVTPSAFSPSNVCSKRTEQRKTSADAAPLPVQMPHGCTRCTGADAASTSADAAPHPCKCRTQPVQMPHTNRQEPSLNHQGTVNFCAEPETGIDAEAPATVVLLPLIDGKNFVVTATDVQEWQQAFPAVDVIAELLRARIWCKDNPQKRKTAKGIRRFVSGWLSKEQDRGGSKRIASPVVVPLVDGIPWWRVAGFEHIAEAQNERCHVGNFHEFRNGKRVPQEATA
jgi:hypothetical protein